MSIVMINDFCIVSLSMVSIRSFHRWWYKNEHVS